MLLDKSLKIQVLFGMTYLCLERTKQKEEGTVFLHFVHICRGHLLSHLKIKDFNHIPHTECVKYLLFLETY